MNPVKRYMTAKEAWLLYQDLSEAESEGGEITVGLRTESDGGDVSVEESEEGGEIDDPSFLPGAASSSSSSTTSDDEEPIPRKRRRLLVTSEGIPSTHAPPSDAAGASGSALTGVISVSECPNRAAFKLG